MAHLSSPPPPPSAPLPSHPRLADSSLSSQLSLSEVLSSPVDSFLSLLLPSSSAPSPPPPLSPSSVLSQSLPRHFHRRSLYAQSKTRQKVERGLDGLQPQLQQLLGTEKHRVSHSFPSPTPWHSHSPPLSPRPHTNGDGVGYVVFATQNAAVRSLVKREAALDSIDQVSAGDVLSPLTQRSHTVEKRH